MSLGPRTSHEAERERPEKGASAPGVAKRRRRSTGRHCSRRTRKADEHAYSGKASTRIRNERLLMGPATFFRGVYRLTPASKIIDNLSIPFVCRALRVLAED
ncbi:unnamed protein product [Hapterophycus canaliculatus]